MHLGCGHTEKKWERREEIFHTVAGKREKFSFRVTQNRPQIFLAERGGSVLISKNWVTRRQCQIFHGPERTILFCEATKFFGLCFVTKKILGYISESIDP